MTKRAMPSLADLIAQTPGAQTREAAHAHIEARRGQWRAVDAKPSGDITQPEPMPAIEDVEQFAKGFWQRKMEDQTPKRGGKPKLVVDNDDDPPPDRPA
ncbi:MAG: hypothetical protein AB7E80_17140 [Hyphomicrobiaceae bacterium]